MSNPCALCPDFIAEYTPECQPSGGTVEVGTKARSTIVDASRQREDGRDQYLSTVQPLIVHVSCRQNYTRKSSINSHRKKLTTDSDNTETTGLRPTAMGSRQFDITKDCLICGENADENRKKKVP